MTVDTPKNQSFAGLESASRSYYETALKQFGDSPKGVNWSSTESQEMRFDILCDVGNLSGQRLHDVGCGLAHMRDYLKTNGVACDYVGSDISEDMIAAAKTRLGETADLHVANIRAHQQDWMIGDYVINSGLFTVKGNATDEEWWSYVQTMIERMFQLCRRGIAFNLMTSYVDYRDDHLFYADPASVFSFCVKNLSRHVVIRHDYPLWEFTVYVYKTEALR